MSRKQGSSIQQPILKEFRGICTSERRVLDQAVAVAQMLSESEEALPRIRILYARLLFLELSLYCCRLTQITRSAHSPNSRLPLRITRISMQQVLVRYKVDSAFLSVLLSFAGGIGLADNGATNLSTSHQPRETYGESQA